MQAFRFAAAVMALVVSSSATAQNGGDGIASFRAHQYTDARRELDVAVRAHPDDAGAHHYLGRIAMHETRFRETNERIAACQREGALAGEKHPATQRVARPADHPSRRWEVVRELAE